MEFKKDEWLNFIAILSGISSAGFDDCIIRDGLIRQSNVSNTMIVSIDTEYKFNFEVQVTKSFIPLYKAFTPLNDEDTLSVETDDSKIYIKDQTSYIEIFRPVEKALSCTFLDDNTFSKFNIDVNNSLLSVSVDSLLLNKLKSVRDNFITTVFKISTKMKKSTVEVVSYSNTRTAKIFTADSNLPDGDLFVSSNVIDFPFDDSFTLNLLEITNSHKYILKLDGKISNKDVSLYTMATSQ